MTRSLEQPPHYVRGLGRAQFDVSGRGVAANGLGHSDLVAHSTYNKVTMAIQTTDAIHKSSNYISKRNREISLQVIV